MRKHLKGAVYDAQQTRGMDILFTFVNPGAECNIIQVVLSSGIFAFLLKQRRSHDLTGFNLVLYRQIISRKYLRIILKASSVVYAAFC